MGRRICLNQSGELADFFSCHFPYRQSVSIRFLGFRTFLFDVLRRGQSSQRSASYYFIQSRWLALLFSLKTKKKVTFIKPASFLIDLLEYTVAHERVHACLGLLPKYIRKMVFHLRRPFPNIVIRGLIPSTVLKAPKRELSILMHKTKPDLVMIDKGEKVDISGFPPSLYVFIEDAFRIYAKQIRPRWRLLDNLVGDVLMFGLRPWQLFFLPLYLGWVLALLMLRFEYQRQVTEVKSS